jgi:hypothetical protein
MQDIGGEAEMQDTIELRVVQVHRSPLERSGGISSMKVAEGQRDEETGDE